MLKINAKSFLIILFLASSAFANEITLSPGSSVYVSPNRPMQVSCSQGSSPDDLIKICRCDYYSDLKLDLLTQDGGLVRTILLGSFHLSSECFDAMKTKPECLGARKSMIKTK